MKRQNILFALLLIACGAFGFCASHFYPQKHTCPAKYLAILETEEPMAPGDSLQVIAVDYSGPVDTIWIGYLPRIYEEPATIPAKFKSLVAD